MFKLFFVKRNRTNIRHIKILIGHNTTKTTYVYVINRSLMEIKDLLS